MTAQSPPRRLWTWPLAVIAWLRASPRGLQHTSRLVAYPALAFVTVFYLILAYALLMPLGLVVWAYWQPTVAGYQRVWDGAWGKRPEIKRGRL